MRKTVLKNLHYFRNVRQKMFLFCGATMRRNSLSKIYLLIEYLQHSR